LPVVNIAALDNAVVLHFETANHRISAYTLASTLVALADAAKSANASINPGFDIEVVVEALGPGSFRAQLKAIYTSARNLFSDQRVMAVILSIVASFIYERTLSVNSQVTVEVRTTEVVIERGQDRVIIPRQVYDATRIAEQNPQFVRAIGRGLEAIAADDKITGIGFVPDMASPPPEVMIPQETIRDVSIDTGDPPNTRVIKDECDLQIVKAILDRTRRKWEFMWRGVKKSAPVLSESFYGDFFAHRITIAPGDELKVRLAIKQSRDPQTGIYANIGYEVEEVFGHIPGLQQMLLPPDQSPER
jgi:hypothetical protein